MYVLHEVAFSASENRDEQRVQFPGGPSNVLGRCFIEVSLREREIQWCLYTKIPQPETG